MSETVEELFARGVRYGSIARTTVGTQVVVGTVTDPFAVPVVVTETRARLIVPGADLTGVPLPRGAEARACCGAVFKRHGERTSHCPGCCETFEGGVLWDAHRVETAVPGRFTCRNAASMIFRGRRLRKVADPVPGVVTVGTWRGPAVDPGVFGGDAA